jgi:SAM-dependent methyltransferase
MSPAATPDEIWLAATWPFVRGQLPPPPAAVTEIGCGSSGGHVPALLRAGYQATGVDPEAPAGPEYQPVRFEDYHPPHLVAAVVASVSLHHVDDISAALDHVTRMLAPGGRIIVVEWASEDFDEATARWCFGHQLADPAQPGAWLAELRAQWKESGLAWPEFHAGWLAQHSLHPAANIQRELASRFIIAGESRGPYYFPDLADASPEAEQAAISSGTIKAGSLQITGKTRQER